MPMMSTLAAASNQGLGAVKQLQPPQNVALATPPTNQYPYQAITGQVVNFTYQERVNSQYDVATGRRMQISGMSVATPRGTTAFSYTGNSYGTNTNNYIYGSFLPDLDNANAGMNLRYFYGAQNNPNRLGSSSQYMTITGGGSGAVSFTATATSGTTIDLSITAPSTALDNVQVYRYNTYTGATSKIFDYTFSGYLPTTINDSGLSPATLYYYYILYHRTGKPANCWTAIVQTNATTQDAPVVTAINFPYSSQIIVDWSNSTNPPAGFTVSMGQYMDLGAGYSYVGGDSYSAGPSDRSASLNLVYPYFVGGSTEGFVSVTVTNNTTGTSGGGVAYNYFYT
jgi:hypothetical protein